MSESRRLEGRRFLWDAGVSEEAEGDPRHEVSGLAAAFDDRLEPRVQVDDDEQADRGARRMKGLGDHRVGEFFGAVGDMLDSGILGFEVIQGFEPAQLAEHFGEIADQLFGPGEGRFGIEVVSVLDVGQECLDQAEDLFGDGCQLGDECFHLGFGQREDFGMEEVCLKGGGDGGGGLAGFAEAVEIPGALFGAEEEELGTD